MKQTSVETIRHLRKQGLTLPDIATQLAVSEEYVEEAFKIIKSEPLQKGYFAAQIEKKKEHNESLRNIQDSLTGNVKYLWRMTRLLEMKKASLENTIREMEKYIKKGSELSDVFAEKGVMLDDAPLGF